MPDAFGLMAVISTLIMGLNLLSDIGTGTVIVQSRRGAESDFLNTAWTLQVIRGFGIWLLGLSLAALFMVGQSQQWFSAGTVFADTRLPLLVAVATFGPAILGFASISLKLAERNLTLARVSLIEVGSQALSLCVMVAAAWATRSVWALVLGGLVAAALKSTLSHAFMAAGPRPAIMLEASAVRELIAKGKWVLMSSLLGFIALNGDRLLLGGLIDSATLGLYAIAVALAGIAPSVLASILGKVAYPALSEVVRDRPHLLARTYQRFQQITDACVGTLAGLLIVLSDHVIALLYDARYHSAGTILAFLAVGSIGMRVVVIEQIYIASGRPALLALAAVPRVLVLILGVPLGHALSGLNGAMLAVVLSQFSQWPLAYWFRWRHSLWDFRSDALLPVAIAAGLGLGALVLRLTALLGTR